MPWEPDYPRKRIPAAIRREPSSIALLLEVVARGQHVTRIAFAVPPLHLLGTAIDDLTFTREVDAIETDGDLVIDVVGHVQVDLLVGVHEARKTLLSAPRRRREEGITPVVRQSRREPVLLVDQHGVGGVRE